VPHSTAINDRFSTVAQWRRQWRFMLIVGTSFDYPGMLVTRFSFFTICFHFSKKKLAFRCMKAGLYGGNVVFRLITLVLHQEYRLIGAGLLMW
jgi:hypothetical protein